MKRNLLNLLVIIIISSTFSVYSQDRTENYAQISHIDLTSPLLDLQWQPDNKFLAISDEDQVIIWDARIQETSQTISTSLISNLAWHPDGQHLAGLGTSLTIWDFDNGTSFDFLSDLNITTTSGILGWHPSGTQLVFSRWYVSDATSSILVQIWNKDTNEIIPIDSDLVSSLHTADWSSNGDMLAIADGDVIRIWDSNSLDLVIEIDNLNNVSEIAWRPDSELLAYGNIAFLGVDDEGTPRFQPSIQVLNTETNELIFQAPLEQESIEDVAWSPDGTVFATTGTNGTILIWELESGQVISTISGHEEDVIVLDWSPNGEMLASGDNDGMVHIWDVSKIANDIQSTE